MEKYYYTKSVIADVLQDMISLDNVLRPLVKNVSVTTNSDGSIPDDNIEISTDIVLDSAQLDALAVVINAYSPAHALVVRYGIETNVMTPAMQYGYNFLSKLSANNIYLGKTAAQINALLADYPELIHAALTGSLISLYTVISTMTADANISQDEIDEFKLRLEIYLGIA